MAINGDERGCEPWEDGSCTRRAPQEVRDTFWMGNFVGVQGFLFATSLAVNVEEIYKYYYPATSVACSPDICSC